MTRLGPLLSLNGSLLSTRAHRLRCLWGLGGSVRGEEAGITQSKTPAPVPCLKGQPLLGFGRLLPRGEAACNHTKSLGFGLLFF